MHRLFTLAVPLCLLFSAACVADTIALDGITYDGVYVRESDSRYYIQIPSTGQTLSVPKSRVDASLVSITKDKAERDALLREWRIHNALDLPPLPQGTSNTPVSHGPSSIRPNDATQEEWVSVEPQTDLRLMYSAPLETHGALAVSVDARQPATRTPSPLGIDKATDGHVQRVKLDDIKLKDALDAVLRPLNLDYEVRDGYIWISTPGQIRTESFEPLEVRTFKLNHAGAEILPKIGLSNMSGPAGVVSGGTGYGGYGSGHGNGYRGAERGAYRGR